jgi:hypothetical protein
MNLKSAKLLRGCCEQVPDFKLRTFVEAKGSLVVEYRFTFDGKTYGKSHMTSFLSMEAMGHEPDDVNNTRIEHDLLKDALRLIEDLQKTPEQRKFDELEARVGRLEEIERSRGISAFGPKPFRGTY